ncbi:hypothetical protein PybrP1_004656, partial [[Pythium] brassicae (nom. inval.)]
PPTGAVTDRAGEQLRFFPAVDGVLSVLELDEQFRGATEVSVASRMTEPDWAKTCMRLLDVELTAEESGVEYADMLFFDNEYGNIRDISAIEGMEAFQQAK